VSEEIEGREAWAHHEAGHAVAGAILGLTIRYVSIVPCDGYAGEVVFEEEITDPWDDLIISLAGGLAVGMYEGLELGEVELSPTNFYGDDWKEISESASELAGGDPDEGWQIVCDAAEKACRILSGNRNSVKALAEALVAHERMEGDRIRPLLRLEDL
jgi:ATP-dependent Zn protease